MRVLMFSWEFPPQVVGGLGRHVYELSRCMKAYGAEPHILIPRADGCPDYEVISGAHVYRVGTPASAAKNFKAWTFGFNREIIRESVRLDQLLGGFDLIHAHDWLVAYGARSLKNVMQVPLVTTIHATEYGRNRGLHNRMQKEIHDTEYNLTLDSQQVICCSEFMRLEIDSLFGINGERVSVIPNGVSMTDYSQVLDIGGIDIPGIDKNDRVIFFVGRLVPEKGVAGLIKAFARVVSEIDNAKLVIAGKGPQEKYLKTMVGELELQEKVTFTGFVDDDQRDQIFSIAEVAVFPSLYEPFGIVALEAMASGTPVVVTDVGGLSEIIKDGLTGIKVPTADDEALAGALIKLMQDHALAETLCKNAHKVIKTQFSWDKIAQETVNVYKQTMQNWS
ncbi:MAG: glycosyltransferase family 4 protein [Acidobacteriota bacterium]